MHKSGGPETLSIFKTSLHKKNERSQLSLRSSYNFIIYLLDFANTMP